MAGRAGGMTRRWRARAEWRGECGGNAVAMRWECGGNAVRGTDGDGRARSRGTWALDSSTARYNGGDRGVADRGRCSVRCDRYSTQGVRQGVGPSTGPHCATQPCSRVAVQPCIQLYSKQPVQPSAVSNSLQQPLAAFNSLQQPSTATDSPRQPPEQPLTLTATGTTIPPHL